MGLLGERLDLCVGELALAGGVFLGEHTAGRHDLETVDTVADPLSGDLPALGRAVGERRDPPVVGPLIRQVVGVTVAAGL